MAIGKTLVVLLLASASPLAAQDLPTDQLMHHADTVRQDMLLKSTLRPRQQVRGSRAAKAAACAQRPQFRRQHGADHPKLRYLDSLCKRDGF